MTDKLTPSLTNITRHRNEADHAQCNQADRVIRRRKVISKSAKEGGTVALTIPTVDGGRGGARNILGAIVQHDQMDDNDMIGVKSGLLKGFCSHRRVS